MLKRDEQGTLIHYPSKPDFFEFDSSVADIFDNMAARSIPLYAEAHRLHAHITRKWVEAQSKRPLQLVDIGASTGGFLYELHRHFWVPPEATIPGLNLHATDISAPMLEKVSEKVPNAKCWEVDILDIATMGYTFDVVNISYVLQFLKPDRVVTAMREVSNSMHSGGLLLISHKERVLTGFSDMFQDRYIEFRRQNGYSQEEIDAKTAALKNSMFPMSNKVLNEILESVGFEQIQETSRWLQFCSMVAIKK